MKAIHYFFVLFMCSHVSVFSGSGAFHKKNADSYHHIVIGKVAEVRVVPLIGNLPATTQDVVNRSKLDVSDDPREQTLLYTGILNIEKPIKGNFKAQDKVMVVWSQAGHSDKQGQMHILNMCPHVSTAVARGQRLVFGLTHVSGSMSAWHIVDGPVTIYEPADTEGDPFTD